MLKQYPKTYEDIFSVDSPRSRKLNFEKVQINGLDLDKYILLFKNSLRESSLALFDSFVKISWLRRRFIYCSENPILKKVKSQDYWFAFSKFTRRFVGSDLQIITRSPFFKYLESYFEIFFPG